MIGETSARPANMAGQDSRTGAAPSSAASVLSLSSILFVLAGGVALFLATQLRNPLYLGLRPVLRSLTLGAPLIVLMLLLRPAIWANRKTMAHGSAGCAWLAIALWLATPIIAATQEGRHLWQRHTVLSLARDVPDAALPQPSETARQLGAHLVISYDALPEMRSLAQSGLIGGVYIGAEALRSRNLFALREEIAELQTVRADAGLPPLIVTTDQEGGIVSRLSPPLMHLPPLAEVIADAPLDDIERRAFDYGALQGRELADLGINVNLAPLADLAAPGSHRRYDLRSLIGQRAIGVDPQRVSRAVIGYTRGLESSGVEATLKHFPGLGRVSGDTHLIPTALAASENDLETRDWIPFREGLAETSALMMVGHATLPTIDATRPASRSRRVVQGIVRDHWKHEGVLITDDLSMGAARQDGTCSAGIEALNAGIDLLLITYDVSQYFEVFACALDAASDGRITAQTLATSDARLAMLRRTNAAIGQKRGIAGDRAAGPPAAG